MAFCTTLLLYTAVLPKQIIYSYQQPTYYNLLFCTNQIVMRDERTTIYIYSSTYQPVPFHQKLRAKKNASKIIIEATHKNHIRNQLIEPTNQQHILYLPEGILPVAICHHVVVLNDNHHNENSKTISRFDVTQESTFHR